MISPPMTGKSFASRRITSKPNCCFSSLPTSSKEVFWVSDMCTCTWFRQTATRPPLHVISSTPLDLSWLVKVGRFSTACTLCPGGGLRFVEKRYTKRCRRLHCKLYWANWVHTHSFSVDTVRLPKVLDVVKVSIRREDYLPFFEGNVRRSPGLDQAWISWPDYRWLELKT